VLRSEIDTYLTQRIGLFVNDPVVRARTYIRVGAFGEILLPGFYLVPPETPLPEAIMLFGGPTQAADLAKIRVDRGGELVWLGEAVLAALSEGLTMDEFLLRSGDRITVPRRPLFNIGQIMTYTVTVAGTIFAIQRILR
jgi:hypothetical protein